MLLGKRPIYTVNNWMNCMHSFLKEIGEKYSIHQRIRILERMHLIIPHLYRFGEFKTWMHYFILVDFLKKRNAYRPRERPEYTKTQGKVCILSALISSPMSVNRFLIGRDSRLRRTVESA